MALEQRATKESVQPCLIYVHLISLVAPHRPLWPTWSSASPGRLTNAPAASSRYSATHLGREKRSGGERNAPSTAPHTLRTWPRGDRVAESLWRRRGQDRGSNVRSDALLRWPLQHADVPADKGKEFATQRVSVGEEAQELPQAQEQKEEEREEDQQQP